MSIKETIQNDIKNAMKQKDQFVVDTLRMIISEVRKGEIDTRKDYTDDDVIKILRKGVKTREDSIDMFKKGARMDLVEKESKEIEIIEKYLPQQLSIEELEKIVDEAISENNITSVKEIGKLMKAVMGKCGSLVDGKTVQEIVRVRLS